ncbi:hypothetical protein NDI52_07270 [Leptolyngbya sp. PL-A3]|uniref:hypothetical protein n=1 Tax=Leptolyngbya sp. PL-A3 TaxID=2933911 RepID=UPI003298F0EF
MKIPFKVVLYLFFLMYGTGLLFGLITIRATERPLIDALKIAWVAMSGHLIAVSETKLEACIYSFYSLVVFSTFAVLFARFPVLQCITFLVAFYWVIVGILLAASAI